MVVSVKEFCYFMVTKKGYKIADFIANFEKNRPEIGVVM